MSEQQPTGSTRRGWRLAVAAGVSSLAVVAAILSPSYGDAQTSASNNLTASQKSYAAASEIARQAQTAELLAEGTVWLPNGTHVHTDGAKVKGGKVKFDPVEKNALSRTTATADDPVSEDQAKANRTAAAKQRAQTEPTLVGKPLAPTRTSVPADKYAMAGGCYGIQQRSSKRWLANPAAPAFTGSRMEQGIPFYFKATDLGSYLLWTPVSTMLSNKGTALTTTPKPGKDAVWTARRASDGSFTLSRPDAALTVRLLKRSGCSTFPEASVNVTGNPTGGVSKQQEVRGYIDAHTHGMAYQFLGGMVHCGKPWDAYGVTVALRDCVDHETTGGKGSVLESFLSGDMDGHDPVGWPTFKDWPAPQSLTHEGTYYKWMERSWRGGQRMLVNLLVENNQLCQLYPLKKNSCNDMDSIRLQARNMHELQRYIDAQSGGPGKGWYRIVRTPDAARRVINAGKLAVVMGVETSVPFNCSQKLGIPQCGKADLDKHLDEMKRMGVSQMELVNKFDNALSGVAGDEGATGVLVNTANTLETGSPWRMQTCRPNVADIHDKNQDAALPGNPASDQFPAEQQDALFGAVAKVSGVNVPALPLYPPKNHCNALGLTDLGAHVIKGMAQRNMLFDPDHMSVKARKSALDLIEQMRYPGVLSSHSWSTIDAYPRIYNAKGFIAPYAGDSDGFVKKWKSHLNWSNPKTYWGFGFGADINGLGAQGNPRKDNTNPVTYPFKGLGGVMIDKQVSGKRVYDINKDGVAQYGLYPDWIEDLRKQAGSAIVKDLARGSEAYLQTWERAYGVRPNACTNGGTLSVATFQTRLRRGTSSWDVLRKVGQPDRRLGSTFTYCAAGGAKVRVTFDSNARVTKVARY